MKCKIFVGYWNQAMDAFNKWAKGKALSKDVIIHTHARPFKMGKMDVAMVAIVVFHPEGAPWEGKEEEPARWDTPIVKE